MSLTSMQETIGSLLASVNEMKEQAGRSEEGRRLAILATKVEDTLAWADYTFAKAVEEETF